MGKETGAKRSKSRSTQTITKSYPKPRPSPVVSAKKTKRKARPPKSVRVSRVAPAESNLRRSGYGVSVTLQLPAMRLHPKVAAGIQSVKLPARVVSKLPPMPRRAKRSIVLALVLAISFTVFIGLHGGSHKSVIDADKVTAKERTKPDFKPLVPSAAEATSSTYDGKRNMISYSTTFSGGRLTVSQQPLPVHFTEDPKALATAADSIHAKQRLGTSKGPIYIATNETNDQLAVFAGKKVLLFIHSDRKLDDPSWKAFIELLKEKS